MHKIKYTGERIGASIVDGLIIGILSSIPILFIIFSQPDLEEYFMVLIEQIADENFEVFSDFIIISAILPAILNVIFRVLIPTYNNGQTIGKMMFKIKAVDGQYNNLPFSRHFLRAVSGWASFVSFGLFILLGIFNLELYTTVDSIFSEVISYAPFVAGIMIIATSDGRGLHDLLAKSYVVGVFAEPLNQRSKQTYSEPNNNSFDNEEVFEQQKKDKGNPWDF